MKKEQFAIIMSNLEARVSFCKKHLDAINTTTDLTRLTIANAVDLKSFCIAEEEIMTRICMVDLYHIIGMGKLTPPQMMKFTYLAQEYLQYRPRIKSIAKNLDSILSLPKIPVETQYKLQGLGDITLSSDFSDCYDVLEDTASIEDYTSLKSDSSNLPFKLDGMSITVDMKQFDYFITVMSTIFKSGISANNCQQKMDAKKNILESHGLVALILKLQEYLNLTISTSRY